MTTPARHIGHLEFERKFLLPVSRTATALQCLGARLHADDRHADSIVSSLYYDTPGLRILREKVDSQLYKTKVRLRWYEDPVEGALETESFLEVKSRVGTRRAKWRRRVGLSAAFLSETSLDEPALRHALRLLEQDPTVNPQGLRPVLVVRYRRRRFDDPLTGARLALDSDLSVERARPIFGTGVRAAHVPVTVLEVKSAGSLPPHLSGFLGALGARATSFSKYHRCVAALSAERGRAA